MNRAKTASGLTTGAFDSITVDNLGQNNILTANAQKELVGIQPSAALTVLTSNGPSATPSFQPIVDAQYATDLRGGGVNRVVYQQAVDDTAFLTPAAGVLMAQPTLGYTMNPTLTNITSENLTLNTLDENDIVMIDNTKKLVGIASAPGVLMAQPTQGYTMNPILQTVSCTSLENTETVDGQPIVADEDGMIKLLEDPIDVKFGGTGLAIAEAADFFAGPHYTIDFGDDLIPIPDIDTDPEPPTWRKINVVDLPTSGPVLANIIGRQMTDPSVFLPGTQSGIRAIAMTMGLESAELIGNKFREGDGSAIRNICTRINGVSAGLIAKELSNDFNSAPRTGIYAIIFTLNASTQNKEFLTEILVNNMTAVSSESAPNIIASKMRDYASTPVMGIRAIATNISGESADLIASKFTGSGCFY